MSSPRSNSEYSEARLAILLSRGLLEADQTTELGIKEQRERVAALKEKLKLVGTNEAKNLIAIADYLIKRSVWIVGGDGWAYDIGYGGLDHVLASNRNVKCSCYGYRSLFQYRWTDVQSDSDWCGCQICRWRKIHAEERLWYDFYGVWSYFLVARVAMGANDLQCVKAFREAEAYNGPSLILAYSHCIAHGINMRTGMDTQKAAVESGHWPLYRYNPALALEGKNPLVLDSKDPKISYEDFRLPTKPFPHVVTKQSGSSQETGCKRSGRSHQTGGISIVRWSPWITVQPTD